MTPLWFFLFLLSAPRCILSQVQLQESGPGLMKPSQTLSLTCTVTGGSVTTSNWWNWIRQPPGKGLQWMGYWTGNTNYNPAFQGRISITADTANNQFSLQLSSVTLEDTAVYYCARGNWGYYFDYWGQGTLVTVSSANNPTRPTLFPMTFRSDKPADPVVIGCLIQDFLPSKPMDVSWDSSGPGASISTVLPIFTSRGLFTMVSQLTLPASQCPASGTLKCHVRHNSSPSQTVDVPCRARTTTPPPTACPYCQPRLALRPPALEDLLLGSDANLTCTLSGLREPQGATFTWNPTGGKKAVQQDPQSDACGCYSVSSVLPGCAEPWNRGQRFSCTANHPETASPLTATIARASGSTFPPQVHLLPPPTEELALNERATLTCVVRGFYPGDVLVRWLHESQPLPREQYQTWGPLPEPGQGGTRFATTSVLRVDTEAWKNGDNFSCMVGHEALPLSFTQKTINRLAGAGLAGSWCLAGCQERLPCVLIDQSQEGREEDAPGASLWPTTVTLLTLFLLSLFYSTALTVTSVRGPPSSREGPPF